MVNTNFCELSDIHIAFIHVGIFYLLAAVCWQRFLGFSGWQTKNKVVTLRNNISPLYAANEFVS